MKVIQPFLVSSECDCDIETYLIFFDDYGVERIECPLHGPPFTIRELVFDNTEDYMKWKAEQELGHE